MQACAAADGISDVVQEETHLGLRYRIGVGMGTAGYYNRPERQKEQRVSEKNPIRVFASHLFDEGDDYLRLFEFLESDDRFYYLNVSKPENGPSDGSLESIKDEFIAQIKSSEVVIILPLIYQQKPDLVSYMMDVAEANGIGMLCVRPFGGLAETSPKIVERVDSQVDWNAREIVDAIKKVARGEDTSRWEVIDFPGFDADETND